MRILLVEDDPLIGSAVRDHIVAAGHAVDWAATLDEAAAHARVAEFGLIILDLAMPDGNGLAFLRALRAGGAATTVIVTARRPDLGPDRGPQQRRRRLPGEAVRSWRAVGTH